MWKPKQIFFDFQEIKIDVPVPDNFGVSCASSSPSQVPSSQESSDQIGSKSDQEQILIGSRSDQEQIENGSRSDQEQIENGSRCSPPPKPNMAHKSW